MLLGWNHHRHPIQAPIHWYSRRGVRIPESLWVSRLSQGTQTARIMILTFVLDTGTSFLSSSLSYDNFPSLATS
jgi:hypothetical protein